MFLCEIICGVNGSRGVEVGTRGHFLWPRIIIFESLKKKTEQFKSIMYNSLPWSFSQNLVIMRLVKILTVSVMIVNCDMKRVTKTCLNSVRPERKHHTLPLDTSENILLHHWKTIDERKSRFCLFKN